MKFHSLNSFITKGLKEYTTWIGIVILFGWIFSKEIHQLISNILTSHELSIRIVDGLSTLIAFLFILFKHKKDD